MKPKATWIDEVLAKRKALFSTTIVVETNDDKRWKEYVTYLEANGRKVVVWDLYQGMSRREGGRELPIQQTSPNNDFLASLGGGGLDPYKEVEQLLRTEQDLTVVVKNILRKDDLNQKAFNLWATDDEIFARRNTVLIFAPDAGFIDLNVLDKQVLVRPPLSTPEERRCILENALRMLSDNGQKVIPISQEEKDALVSLGGGLNQNKAEAVYIETILATGLNSGQRVDLSIVAENKSQIIRKTKILDVMMQQPFGFEGVGGYNALKKHITETVINVVQDKRRADALGVEQPKGFIMFGPGGTGKSLFARCLTKELGYPFISLRQENFMTSYVGESERNLKQALQIIDDMAPNVVFIDEIDRLGGRGESSEQNGGTSQRIFSMLLEWLGDPRRTSIVIGATNMPYLDPAFRREGRFDMLVPMLSPDLDARRQILNVHLNVVRKVNHNLSAEVLEQVALDTEHWKGNMLEELVKRATRLAFTKGKTVVEDDDLLDAKADYVVNVKALEEDEQKYLRMANELCNSRKFLNELGRKTGVGENEVVSGRQAVLRAMMGAGN